MRPQVSGCVTSPALQDGRFLAAFLDKGRMRGLVEAMPVRVICNEQVSLQGLARVAALRAQVAVI